MKNQKGFIVPLLIAIIAILVTIEGSYLYLNQNPQNITQGATETNSTSTNSSDYDSSYAQFYGPPPKEDQTILTDQSPAKVIATTTKVINTPSLDLNTSYDIGVLVLKYFPTVMKDGVEVMDIKVTGDIGDPYALIHQRTIDTTNHLKDALEKATTYLGYKDASARPALRYNIVDTFEYKTGVPFNPDNRRPLYKQIMLDHNICDYVDNKGVREVWIHAYQGPTSITTPSGIYPYLNIWESTMSPAQGSPFFANGGWLDEPMPVCSHTYRVYTFNDNVGADNALHSWGHQIEAEMRAFDSKFFVDIFQGPYHPQTDNQVGRCGSVHNPPNSREEYDYHNTIPQKSDCLDWNPDGLGTLTEISCTLWGCDYIDDTNNFQLNYLVWMWQNLPGRNNNKSYRGKKIPNLWDIHGDFDKAIAHKSNYIFTK
jgi:hypothetical protein